MVAMANPVGRGSEIVSAKNTRHARNLAQTRNAGRDRTEVGVGW